MIKTAPTRESGLALFSYMGGVGIVTDKNYDKLASAETKAAVEAAQNAILNGEVVVDSALTNQELATQLRDAVRP